MDKREMKKVLEAIQELIDEAKIRVLYWAVFIFSVTYLLSHTSKSMWMNVPAATVIVSILIILVNEVECHQRVPSIQRRTYLTHLAKKQLTRNDPRLSSRPPPQKWKRKIDSPVVEAALDDFVDKLLKEFVLDLWYGDITPDKDVPEMMRGVIMNAFGEISSRVKEINLVDLLTKDIVNLIGDHLDLFRRNHAAIGVDVMESVSSEEWDERLKHHLMPSKELHPALISPESEYKVLQQLIGGVLSLVLRPQESQCTLVLSIAQELVTCLVLQPVMNLANPMYINQLMEFLFHAITDYIIKELRGDKSKPTTGHHPACCEHNGDAISKALNNQASTMKSSHIEKDAYLDSTTSDEEHIYSRHNDWARMLEAATQRRAEVLTPENLENLWTKGRNYKKKDQRKQQTRQDTVLRSSADITSTVARKNLAEESSSSNHHLLATELKRAVLMPTSGLQTQLSDTVNNTVQFSSDLDKSLSFEERVLDHLNDTIDLSSNRNAARLKRSNSTSDLRSTRHAKKTVIAERKRAHSPDFISPKSSECSEEPSAKNATNFILPNERQLVAKLSCQVMGAYFENLGSKPFAVYSIAVTDADNRTWFVNRRYSNFERLHRNLKDIPNYTLNLPPKRIFSSSTEESFVHQRCIQLNKYLQDLLSVANISEEHEVLDFLSASSKKYSFGKSRSVMRTLAVNVDDVVDDIVRQFRGISDGSKRKALGPPSSNLSRHLSWNTEDSDKQASRQNSTISSSSFSNDEDGDSDGCVEDESSAQGSGWHSGDESNSQSVPLGMIRCAEETQKFSYEKSHDLDFNSEGRCCGGFPAASTLLNPTNLGDPIGMPPEWTPSNVSVPLLNLVDKVFQLKRRGWIRRQVFWISKQILHLVMEDAIDGWLFQQINWLRKEETVAQGIRLVQDVLWPNGSFFINFKNSGSQVDESGTAGKPLQIISQLASIRFSKSVSFEEQIEATRRAREVKKIIYDGAPAALVGLIGNKQYKRCARDIYYFIQSTVCVKQLAYAVLELILVSVFPELRNLVMEIHEKMYVRVQQHL